MRKNFQFYLNWRSQIDLLDDHELRRFINNLINWHEDLDVELITTADKLVWNGVLPGLKVNDAKWKEKAEKSRENGRSGGRPKSSLDAASKTQQVFQKPVNSKELTDNRKELIDNREELTDNIEELNLSNNKFIENIINDSQPVNINLNAAINPSVEKNKIIPDKYIEVVNKRNNYGWNSLSVKEVTLYNECIELMK
jgi:hypothetical protein